MVLISHSFAIATGDVTREPLRLWLGVTPGTIAVDVFFIVSGLLVTQSMERHANALTFARARFLRVWPGLLVAMLFTVFVLGVVLTSLPLSDYLSDKRTWQYLAKNLVVVYRTAFSLPGVFSSNPFPDSVNGSLWTLRHEVRAYAFLLLTWWVAYRLLRRGPWFSGLVLAITCVAVLMHLRALSAVSVESSSWRLYAMFAMGGALYMLRSRVSLAFHWGVMCAIALAFAVLYPPAFGYAYSLLLPYLVIWLAYAPAGALSYYNRAGDYSYGTYIYAFPIQQTVALALPGISISGLFGLSFAVTLLFAVASWHLIEKPAMSLKTKDKRKASVV